MEICYVLYYAFLCYSVSLGLIQWLRVTICSMQLIRDGSTRFQTQNLAKLPANGTRLVGFLSVTRPNGNSEGLTTCRKYTSRYFF